MSLRLADRLRVLWAYWTGSRTVACLPTHLWIESTSRCNLRCPMCPTGLAANRHATGFMDIDLFRRILDQAGESGTVVYLHLAGEPLLHPRLPEMVKLCAERGVVCGFFTNGTLLTRERGRELIAAGLDWLGFSFDGWDETSHASLRVGSTFDETLAHIESFLELRREMDADRPVTTLSMIELAATRTDAACVAIERLRRRLEDAGLDQFSVTPAHRWAETPVPDAALAGPPPEDPPRTRCPFPWTGLAFRWDGTYLPCCLDLTGRMRLGSVLETPLEEFWNGQTMQEFRSKMATLSLETLPLCEGCHVVRDRGVLGLPVRVWREFYENVTVSWSRGRRTRPPPARTGTPRGSS